MPYITGKFLKMPSILEAVFQDANLHMNCSPEDEKEISSPIIEGAGLILIKNISANQSLHLTI